MRNHAMILFAGILLAVAPAPPALFAQPDRDETFYGKTLSAWLKQLESSEKAERIAAAQALASQGEKASERMVPALLEALKDRDAELKLEVLRALANHGPKAKAAVPALVQALKHDNEGIRYWAARGLKGIGADAREAAPKLSESLLVEGPKGTQTSYELILALTNMGPEGASFLLAALKHEDRDYRLRLAKTLAGQGKVGLPIMIEALKQKESRLAVTTALCDMDDASPAIPALTKAFESGDTVLRAEIPKALRKMNKDALPLLLVALAEKEPDVRNSAIIALSYRQHYETLPGSVLPVLIEGLKDTTLVGGYAGQEIRERCAVLLSRMGPAAKSAVPALAEALKNYKVPPRFQSLPHPRATILDTLAAIGPGEPPAAAVPVLIETLKERDIYWRIKAAVALGKIGPEAKEALPALAQSWNAINIRYGNLDQLVQAIAHIGPDSVPVLVEFLQNKEKVDLREAAAKALGTIKKADSAVPALITAMDKDEATVVRHESAKSLGEIAPQQKKVVAAMIEALKDKAPTVRYAAVGALGKAGPEARSATGAMIELLTDTDSFITDRAADTLFRIGQPVLPDLIAAFKHDRIPVRQAAIRVVMRFQVMAVPALLDGIRNKDEVIRLGSADVLRKMEPAAKTAVPGLIEALKSTDEGVPHVAAYALEGLGPDAKEATAELGRALKNSDSLARQWAAAALGKIGPEAKSALPNLREALGDSEARVRSRVVVALGQLGPAASDAVPALIALFGKADAGERKELTDAIFQIGSSALPALIDSFKSDDAGVRQGAMATMRRFGPRYYDDLATAFKNEDVRIRRVSIEILGQYAPRSIPLLVEGIHDKDEQVRLVSARVLASAGSRGMQDPKATKALIEALKAKESSVRGSAALALSGLGRKAKEAVPALGDLLKDDNADTRQHAIIALAAIGPHAKAVLPALQAALKDSDPDVRTQAAAAITKIDRPVVDLAAPWITKLESKDVYTRLDAAQALARLGEEAKSAVPALSDALGDRDLKVRSAAAVALGSIGPDAADAIPKLVEAIKKETFNSGCSDMTRALGKLRAVPALIEVLQGRNRFARAEAAAVLGLIGPEAKSAVPILMKTLKDDDLTVRARSFQALGGIGPDAKEAVPTLLDIFKNEKSANTRNLARFALKKIDPDALEKAEKP